MYLASICLLPPHPQMKVVWGDHLCPHAFSSQLSWRREYKISTNNKPSKRDVKDKKKFKKRRGRKLRSTTADSSPWKPWGRQCACVLPTVHLRRPLQPPPVLTLFNTYYYTSSLLSDCHQIKVQMPIINVSPQMFSANPIASYTGRL